MSVESVDAWADALDKYQGSHELKAEEFISIADATGEAAGVTLDPRHPAVRSGHPCLAARNGWVVRYLPQDGWWEEWPLWTLAYETADNGGRAWVLRHGIMVRKWHALLGPDDDSRAQKWFTDWLADRLNVAVTGWMSHRPDDAGRFTRWIGAEADLTGGARLPLVGS